MGTANSCGDAASVAAQWPRKTRKGDLTLIDLTSCCRAGPGDVVHGLSHFPVHHIQTDICAAEVVLARVQPHPGDVIDSFIGASEVVVDVASDACIAWGFAKAHCWRSRLADGTIMSLDNEQVHVALDTELWCLEVSDHEMLYPLALLSSCVALPQQLPAPGLGGAAVSTNHILEDISYQLAVAFGELGCFHFKLNTLEERSALQVSLVELAAEARIADTSEYTLNTPESPQITWREQPFTSEAVSTPLVPRQSVQASAQWPALTDWLPDVAGNTQQSILQPSIHDFDLYFATRNDLVAAH